MHSHTKLVDRVVLNSNSIALSDELNPPPYDPLLRIPGSVNIVSQGLGVDLEVYFFVQATDFLLHEFHRFYAKLAPHVWAVEVTKLSEYGNGLARPSCAVFADGPDEGLLIKDGKIQFIYPSIQEIRERYKDYSDTPLTYGILTFDEAGKLLRVDGPIARESITAQWKYGNATISFLYGVNAAGEVTEESWIRPTEVSLDKPQLYYEGPVCIRRDLQGEYFDGVNILDVLPMRHTFPWPEPIQMNTQLADNVFLYNQSPALSDEDNPPPYDPLLKIPGSVNIVSGGLDAAVDIEFPVYTSDTSQYTHIRTLHRVYAKLASHVWAVEIYGNSSDRLKSHHIKHIYPYPEHPQATECTAPTIQTLREIYADSPKLPLSYGILTFNDQGELLRVDGPIGQKPWTVQWVDGTLANVSLLYGINAAGEVTKEPWLRPRETAVFTDFFSRGADLDAKICSKGLYSAHQSYMDKPEPCAPVIREYETCIFNGVWETLWDPPFHYFHEDHTPMYEPYTLGAWDMP